MPVAKRKRNEVEEETIDQIVTTPPSTGRSSRRIRRQKAATSTPAATFSGKENWKREPKSEMEMEPVLVSGAYMYYVCMYTYIMCLYVHVLLLPQYTCLLMCLHRT